MSQSGDELEEEKLNSSEEEELQRKQDAAEEPFDPEKPHDLVPTTEQCLESEDEDEEGAVDINAESDRSSEDEDESDDSIVCDVVESQCSDHEFFIEFSKKVDEYLLSVLISSGTQGKERRAAIAELLCDHYATKSNLSE